MTSQNKQIIFILAGGLGTRLQSVVSDIPKPMAPISDKPFLDYQIDWILEQKIPVSIVLLTHHLSDYIHSYYKDHPNVTCLKEPSLLGTGGSIKNALKELGVNSSFTILNGDTYSTLDFNAFYKNASQEISMVVTAQDDCARYGTVEMKDSLITGFREKDSSVKKGYVNAGIYFFKSPSFFDSISQSSFSLEDHLSDYLDKGHYISSFVYDGVFIDIGIPSDYEKMKKLIQKVNVDEHR